MAKKGGFLGQVGGAIAKGGKELGGGISKGWKDASKYFADRDPMGKTTPKLDPNEILKPITIENPYEQEMKGMLGRELGPDFGQAQATGRSQTDFARQLEGLFGAGSGGLSGLISTLQKQQAGDFGPGGSLAQKVLEQGLQKNIAGVRSQLASQRGLSPALAARYAAQQTAQLGGEAAQQAALLGLQQQLAAQQLLGSLSGTAAGLGSKAGDIWGKAREQDITQAAAASDAALKRLDILSRSDIGIRQLQAQTGMNEQQLRAKIAEANQAAAAGDMERRDKILSGILSGISQVGAGAASAGAFGSGAAGAGGAGAAGAAGAAASDKTLKKNIKKLSDSDIDEFLSAVEPKSYQYKDSQYGEGDKVGFMMQDVADTKVGKLISRELPDGKMGYDPQSLQGVVIAALARKNKAEGGRIEGKAKVKGDSPKNDTVPINASPGEIIIPRSAAGSREAAKSFIDSLDDFDDEPSYGKVLKARQKKNYADGGRVEDNDIEAEIQKKYVDDYRQRQLEQGFDVPIPGVGPAKAKLDEMLTSRVVEPMARAGYPTLGAAMATVPSTLAEALVPSTAADLAGTLIPFPKAFLTKDAKKVLKAQKTPTTNVNYTVDWANNYYLQSMMERVSDDPKIVKKIEDILKAKGEEPYVGDFTNAVWRTTPSLKQMGLPQPIPQQVENLKGVLGKEVPKGGSDPFAWMDTKYEVTKKLLEKNTETPLTINTRSDLIANDDYMSLLNPSKHKINIHLLGDMDMDRLARFMEPGAPSIRRRLNAAKKLSEAGFDVTLVKDVLQNKNMPKELQQMLFQSQPTDGFKVKQNVVDISDEAVDFIKRLVGDNFK